MTKILNHINTYQSEADYQNDNSKNFPNVSYIEEDDIVMFAGIYPFAIVMDISNYTDRLYTDVYDRTALKWYKLNSNNEYEEYGVFGTSRNDPYYEGKLVLEDDYEYEWNGSEWVNVGEHKFVENWIAPTDDELQNVGVSNDLCSYAFNKYRFTLSAPTVSTLTFSNEPCQRFGHERITGPWEVGTIYETSVDTYLLYGSNSNLVGKGFEMLTTTEIIPKKYETIERPMFAKAYDTLDEAETDKINVGLNAAAILPNNDIYTFTHNGLELTDDYVLLGRLNDTEECLYQPVTDNNRQCQIFSNYLDRTKLNTVNINGYLANDIFNSCTSLANVNFDENFSVNTNYSNRFFNNCTSLPVEGNIRYADTMAVGVVDTTVTNYTFNVKEGTKMINGLCFTIGQFNRQGWTITLPNSVEYILYEAFYYLSIYPNYLNLPSNLKYIGNGAFEHSYAKGNSFVIPDSVETIGGRAFFNNNYNYLTIGSGVKTIGSKAFCTEQTSTRDVYVTCRPTVPPTIPSDQTNQGLWDTHSSIRYIKVPSASVTRYKNADGWKSYSGKIQSM